MNSQAFSPSARLYRRDSRGRRFLALLAPLLVAACSVPGPFVAPSVVGKAPSEVARLVAASDSGLFPCAFIQVSGDSAVTLGAMRTDLTLAPGRYVILLQCASAYHSFKPRTELNVRPGKTYRITGYLVDNSITIFTMRMSVRVEELSQ